MLSYMVMGFIVGVAVGLVLPGMIHDFFFREPTLGDYY